MPKRGVGLVVCTNFKEHGLVAVLQRRGFWNFGKLGAESFRGLTQVTCHGRLKENEEMEDGLLREMKEELGSEFAATVWGLKDRLRQVAYNPGPEEVETFGIFLPDASVLSTIRLEPGTGGLILLRPDDPIEVVDRDKKHHLIPIDRVLMFDDEMKAVQKAFGLYANV